MKKIQAAAAEQQSYTRFLKVFLMTFKIKIKYTRGGGDPKYFLFIFSQNPELYFTHLLYTCIYYIFGCAARAVGARFPTSAHITIYE